MVNKGIDMYNIESAPKVDVEHVLKRNEKELLYVENVLKKLNVNMDYFYKNANNVKFITDESVSSFMKKCSYYESKKNKIITSSNYHDDSVTHELFHMSSTIIDGYKSYVGFNHADFSKKTQIGIGLNEGCTALFDERYCGDYTKEKRKIEEMVYPLSKTVVKDLEITLGTEELLKSYFNADLKNIYNLLSNLMGKKRTMEFLYTFDALFYCSDDVSKFRPRMIHLFYPEIIVYTAEAFYTKITDKYRAGTLSKEEYDKYLQLVKSILGRRIKVLSIPITENMSYAYEHIQKHYDKNYEKRLELGKTTK